MSFCISWNHAGGGYWRGSSRVSSLPHAGFAYRFPFEDGVWPEATPGILIENVRAVYDEISEGILVSRLVSPSCRTLEPHSLERVQSSVSVVRWKSEVVRGRARSAPVVMMGILMHIFSFEAY